MDYDLENCSVEQAYYLSQIYNDFIESELLQIYNDFIESELLQEHNN